MLRTALPRLFSWNTAMRPHHAPVLFTVAAVLSCRPLTTLADAPRNTFPLPSDPESDERQCPFYGCPLLPQDVHYNTDVMKQAFEQIRQLKRNEVSSKISNFKESGRSDAATFTLIGYKGGPLMEQINQDRAIVVSPYIVPNSKVQNGLLLGVFDGHAPLGEKVSEYTATELPKVLANKLSSQALVEMDDDDDEQEKVNMTKQVLIETFIELDKNAPAQESGGCTATIVLQQDRKVYIANAGDSRSFLCAYRPSTGETQVLYISREDKPDLPDERARVEQMGGQVYIPLRGTSRVVYHDPQSGAPTGLAMSRSIGDWAAGKLGVIPDPIVEVFDLEEIVKRELYEQPEVYVVDEEGDVSILDEQNDVAGMGSSSDTVEDDVHIFAVSATDGMMDFVAAEEIARILSHSLFDQEGSHLITACEQLIFAAANAWQESKQGRYRDDIAIAVSTLRTPPKKQKKKEAD